MDMRSYHKLWTEAWRLFRKYGELIPLTDTQWEAFVDEIEEFVERSEHDKLATQLMLEISNEIERREKMIQRRIA